jgi:hypothetical protein
MRASIRTLAAAAIATLASAGLATGKGEPPVLPPDPPPYTVIAHGIGTAAVGDPLHQTDDSIEHVVRLARAGAMPEAVTRARAEAQALAAAAGLTLGPAVGVARDTPPLGSYVQDDGEFGVGKWCGRIYLGSRRVRRADGTIRRVSRFRYGCRSPKTTTVRVTVIFAATPGS